MEMKAKLKNRPVNVGVGFVTGRKGFRKLARTYLESWYESGLLEKEGARLSLFVAYDLKYRNTTPADYKNLDKRILEALSSPFYIGEEAIRAETAGLIGAGVISEREAELLFGEGYAKKRNVILYFAIKNGMDYLLFLDDDEYPMAVLRQPEGLTWRGQKVLATHLKYIESADITHGYHCGYVSPIPTLAFDDSLGEEDFRVFIEAISNDIISWDSIREKMKNNGVSYAAGEKMEKHFVRVVKEVDGAKFISGSNLCLNLKDPERVFPFYNPPGARGEDTFLSTCLSDRRVLKVPCYTFHDGFSSYTHLLCGILPEQLRPVRPGSGTADERFLKACIGWIRYKPLLLFITRPDQFESEIERMKNSLRCVLPKICAYFGNKGFMCLTEELERYAGKVPEHYEMFEETKSAWKKVTDYLCDMDQDDGRIAYM